MEKIEINGRIKVIHGSWVGKIGSVSWIALYGYKLTVHFDDGSRADVAGCNIKKIT
jgi:hypothetical protein